MSTLRDCEYIHCALTVALKFHEDVMRDPSDNVGVATESCPAFVLISAPSIQIPYATLIAESVGDLVQIEKASTATAHRFRCLAC